jgi:diphosphomevalonate decarboxylase
VAIEISRVKNLKMRAEEIVKTLLNDRTSESSKVGFAFAPVNFALIKYWGKRNLELNLPMTSSLSLTLPEKGAFTTVQTTDHAQDAFVFNHRLLPLDHVFTKNASNFLDLFRKKGQYFHVETQINLPAASGLASSACGFAALTLALNNLFDWQLSDRSLSILARLGSGSACRSLWEGFVEWQVGSSEDGMDSYGTPIGEDWNSLCLGLLVLDSSKKKISSREAMQKTVVSSCYYPLWPQKVAKDLSMLKEAIRVKDFEQFGEICESNSLAMHASMLTAWPPILYWTTQSLEAMQKIWQLRQEGLPIYFTQDAGPNLKLLFLHEDLEAVRAAFPRVEFVWPFTPSGAVDQVVLVNEDDRAIGVAEKIFAHQHALCHRAFSVFVFRKANGKLELLMQQRQQNKYHCGGLWTNTCCSHPRPGESILAAAQRRLKEEIGSSVPLVYKGFFHYVATFKNQLTENEVDHVFVGYGEPTQLLIDKKEIADLRWISVDELQNSLVETPQRYTPWFKQALEIALSGDKQTQHTL